MKKDLQKLLYYVGDYVVPLTILIIGIAVESTGRFISGILGFEWHWWYGALGALGLSLVVVVALLAWLGTILLRLFGEWHWY